MSANAWITATIAIYFAAMIAIGFWSYRRTTNLGDYMLGGRSLGPFTAALSAGASDMSGWLLMGLPGAIYVTGLIEAWIAVGLTIGAWLNWMFVAPRLRSYTQVAGDSITIPSYLSNRVHDSSRVLRIVAGLVICVFFTFYVSSGMVAGGKFFNSTFGTEYLTGMLILAGVVILYTFIGGFLAVSYTDVIQGVMMVIALIAVPVAATIAVGGPGEVISTVREIDPAHFSLIDTAAVGTSLVSIISALAWGLGYFGQPHIIVRFMALRNAQEAAAGRRIGIGWMIFAVAGAVATGLAGAAYVQKTGFQLVDSEAGETVFLDLGQTLFHPAVAGFMLAAVLAAIMSTISSQLLVSSSALVEDIAALSGRSVSHTVAVWLGRLGVLIIAVIAALLAVNPSDTILDLVAFAWAGFGASFGPLVLLSLFWKRLTAPGAIAGLICGAVVVFGWKEIPVFADTGVYEIIPGFLAGLLGAIVVSLVTKTHPAVDEEFETARVRARRDFVEA